MDLAYLNVTWCFRSRKIAKEIYVIESLVTLTTQDVCLFWLFFFYPFVGDSLASIIEKYNVFVTLESRHHFRQDEPVLLHVFVSEARGSVAVLMGPDLEKSFQLIYYIFIRYKF